ncbi:sigma-54-dependent Fis family transcriptional regulator [Capnocytophaga canimorsus]|uniref:Sigma-54-dependent Fis family transcriptional regulator n=1 Tax=Capnocytophaga canimorsus TaxID=28188 RepID=A0A250G202_9FLAO|nr:sigma-54 dependent transcriptional regulator [Capnocytophaga canimorsus]ATA91271.1 sigma-54-dependent Fis family transcriptional regulator [Capnocytophaga canimorsus]
MNSILLVEDDIAFAKILTRFLQRNGYFVQGCYSMEEAKRNLKSDISLVFTDLRLPDGDGIQLLKEIKAEYPHIPVVVMTSYAEVSTAVEAMKLGAFDYISKPFQQDEVLNVIQNAERSNTTAQEKKSIKKIHKSTATSTEKAFIEGISNASKKLNDFIRLVAPTDMSVLITGESGTGKEVVAQSIHLQSERADKPFVAVDCGAIPKEIAASEFFGHIKGSFTGAISDKKGHFEQANGGTIFLDEVGNLSYDNQVQLLRALQERRIKPIGSSQEIDVDIRVLAATNEDLLTAVEKGQFREDLYHRLNEFSIKVPSLHERKDDLMIFAEYFLEQANKKLRKKVLGFSETAVQKMLSHSWSGNLRELSNAIKRATLLAQGSYITEENLPDEVTEQASVERTSFSTKENEKELILQVLKQTGNNKTEAAKLLNITRKTLYNKIKAYNIDL